MVRRRKFRLPTMRLTLPRASRVLFRSLNVWGGQIAPAAKTIPLGQVVEVTDFGSNPGQLRMYVYTPKKSYKPNAPLIVVLHGCGQYQNHLLKMPAGLLWRIILAYRFCCRSR
jgi:poly(3-hydroxybutyrate) depolymerase